MHSPVNKESIAEKRLRLFPLTTTVTSSTPPRLAIAGLDLNELAEMYGTPLYLYDQATLDGAVRTYRSALAAHYPGESYLTYAGKAYLSVAMAQWATGQGLWVDCTGTGEMHIARTGNVPRERILVHGVNKSEKVLKAAMHWAGTIVVDNLTELTNLAGRNFRDGIPSLWLRMRPGLAVDTHAYQQTGQAESKFGLSRTEVSEAVDICRTHSLPLKGLHFHLGSHFHDPTPIGPAIHYVLNIIAELQQKFDWTPSVLCPGGGWGVPYHEDDLPHEPVDSYVAFIAKQLVTGCEQRSLSLPALQLEPGRSLVAQAGVAIYRIGAVKRSQGRKWLLLDGGMADNIRPALYGARYSALPVIEPLRETAEPAWVAGPYCESGDVLIEELPMPDLKLGDLVAVPVSGAYHLMMGSNYNGAQRPAVVWLRSGEYSLIQRRETLDDLIQRDRPLSQLTG